MSRNPFQFTDVKPPKKPLGGAWEDARIGTAKDGSPIYDDVRLFAAAQSKYGMDDATAEDRVAKIRMEAAAGGYMVVDVRAP